MSFPLPAAIDESELDLEARPGGIHAARFQAMGCPCEILVASADAALAGRIAGAGVREALRIERKYSRYREDSLVSAINRSAGRAVPIDAETEGLLDYAAHCSELSGGLFDVTSGVLRRAWRFDGSDRVPSPVRIQSLLRFVGFARLERTQGSIIVPPGMEIDLGGIAKEYAVDRVIEGLASGPAASEAPDVPVLVNFGGDLRASAAPGAQGWQVGVERTDRGAAPAMVLDLARGALATSGDSHRYVLRDGRRYGHILDPRTGWPIRGAPRSITVAAGTCIEAGTLATVAMLQGPGAARFLQGLGVRHWCLD